MKVRLRTDNPQSREQLHLHMHRHTEAKLTRQM
jgi:hypothetical protein